MTPPPSNPDPSGDPKEIDPRFPTQRYVSDFFRTSLKEAHSLSDDFLEWKEDNYYAQLSDLYTKNDIAKSAKNSLADLINKALDYNAPGELSELYDFGSIFDRAVRNLAQKKIALRRESEIAILEEEFIALNELFPVFKFQAGEIIKSCIPLIDKYAKEVLEHQLESIDGDMKAILETKITAAIQSIDKGVDARLGKGAVARHET